MSVTADVVVVGLGAVGSATLHRLAMRGVRAIGIDRFHPPHDRGSTHGDSRITRLAIGEGAAYVPMVQRSHEIWRELESQTGETLFQQIGMLIIAEGDGAPSHGQAGFLGSTIAIAQSHDIPHELLDSAEIRHRYPQFQVRDAERGYFEPSAGVLSPERCVAVQLRLAQSLGATVRTGETVLSITPSGSGVAVETDQGRIEAARVILTAGAWLPGLAGGHISRVTSVERQTLLWFETDEPELYHPARCPVFIWQHGPRLEDYLYGFPLLPGTSGVKAATERYAGHTHPDEIDRVVSEEEVRTTYQLHIASKLRGVSDRLVKAATCLYTVTPDAHFIVDRLWENDAVIAASACSGHGFKHSPAMGEHLATLATEPAAAYEPAFALSRFGAAA
ncbi:N-methyl-L-tryptophan oxidase [Acidisphaera sp. L21]|uniref:N-methyl-L-tryptophan oxidase n=1 Tax=Acidisphaera sp. L21 TaxID=1641851 RepID=UPI00131C5A2E|nr:N-methyl-L-tryptophan oxidase [Acidisphaera sp. L21]